MVSKERHLERIKEAIMEGRKRLHPTDHSEACREIETFCAKEAKRQEEANDANGVPERR